MLQAVTKQGERIILALLTKTEITNIRSKLNFYCPICNQMVIVKAGSKQIAHFAHKQQNSCEFSGGGEGAYHEHGKLDLYQWLRKHNLDPELEKYFPEIKQRADLFFRIGGKKVVIEYQCARISVTSIIKRTKGFQSLRITPIWVLGGNRFKRKAKGSLYITSTELHFIQRLSSKKALQLLYYCPNQKQFALFHNLMLTGRKETLGNLTFIALKDCRLTQLFPLFKEPSYQLWQKEKEYLRINIPIQANKLERQWREWLYLKKQSTQTMSAWIHLPVPDQWKMTVPPWNWQSRLCFDFFMRREIFNWKECQAFLTPFYTNSHNYPLITSYEDPVRQYLQLFIYRKQIKEIQPQCFQLVRPIQTYATLDLARKKDQQLIDFLINQSR